MGFFSSSRKSILKYNSIGIHEKIQCSYVFLLPCNPSWIWLYLSSVQIQIELVLFIIRIHFSVIFVQFSDNFFSTNWTFWSCVGFLSIRCMMRLNFYYFKCWRTILTIPECALSFDCTFITTSSSYAYALGKYRRGKIYIFSMWNCIYRLLPVW